jgi:DNA-binding MarR family transcriptional regulator
MKHTPAGEAFTELVLTGLILGALLEQAGDALTSPMGQTAARWRVLAHASKAEMTVAEIARSLKQSRQSVLKIADALSGDGLTVYVDNPGDRRAKLLKITARGRAILSAIHDRQRLWANRLGSHLKNEEVIQIGIALKRMVELLNNAKPATADTADQ